MYKFIKSSINLSHNLCDAVIQNGRIERLFCEKVFIIALIISFIALLLGFKQYASWFRQHHYLCGSVGSALLQQF